MNVLFRLARQNSSRSHKDRQAHLQGSQYLLPSVPDVHDQRFVADSHLKAGIDAADSSSTAAGGDAAQLESVAEGYRLYLGETCVFHFTLSNQGSTPVSDISIKVECAVEGGSKAVLHDNGTSPLSRLPPSGRHDVIVTTDVKEQGQVELVASAVFTDHLGERKYHVQFFKLSSASPLSVRTRMRCLPHVQQRSSSSSSNSSTDQQQQAVTVPAAAAAACTRCFLEVSVENSTSLPLVLHAVRLLTPAVITTQQLTLCEAGQQQQQQCKPQFGQRESSSSSMQHKDSSSGGSDTQLLHDVEGATFVHQQQLQQQKQQQQHKSVINGLEQMHVPQQQQQQQQQGSSLGPLLQGQAQPLAVPPAGSHNYLWQVDHQHLPTKMAAAAAPAGNSSDTAAPTTPSRSGSSSSSGGGGGSGSSSVGRLELHWSSTEGKTGRLLTQPLSTLAAGWHRDVLMQLTKLQPAAAAGGCGGALNQAADKQQQHQPFPEFLVAGVPVVATFTLTAAASAHQHAPGPLLVLYSELPLTGLGTPAGAAAGQPADASSYNTNNSSSLPRRQSIPSSGPNSSSSSGSSTAHPAVAVQGPRIRRLPHLQPGQRATVSFVLLPLRRGWLRLPNFMVVSEADGRLLDSVREVQLLVV